jgi:hypothetical protein
VSLVKDAVDLGEVARERGFGAPVDPEIAIMRTITAYMGMSTLSTLRCEEMHVESLDLVSSIVSRAREREVAAMSLNNLTTYVGNPSVDTLFLGNVRGPGIRHELAPAFMPYPSTCGEYLMEALVCTDFGLTPRLGGIANAWDVDSLGEIIARVTPRRIVAFGAKAYNEARKFLPQVCEVGHPSRMRTLWGSGNARGWADVIKRTTHELDRSHRTT